MNTLFSVPAAILACALAGSAVAADNVRFSGTLISAPCKINSIDVDFGTRVVTDVPAGKVAQTVNYTMSCTGVLPGKSLKMRITGTGAGFDSQALKTSIAALGIKMQADGVVYPLNSSLSFASPTARPVLKALLVQQAGARLPTGGFTATATMMVDYQ